MKLFLLCAKRLLVAISLILVGLLILFVLFTAYEIKFQPTRDREYCGQYISLIELYFEENGAYPDSIAEIETPPKTGWRIAPYCQIQVFEDTYILSFRSWKKGLDGYEVYDAKHSEWR